MELDPTLVGLREDPVEDDDVVVEVGVETRTEAVQERDSAPCDVCCTRGRHLALCS